MYQFLLKYNLQEPYDQILARALCKLSYTLIKIDMSRRNFVEERICEIVPYYVLLFNISYIIIIFTVRSM